MDALAEVEIDAGKFKYVLLKVNDAETKSEKIILRGSCAVGFHGDLVDKVGAQLRAIGKSLSVECTGGGIIVHKPKEKTINVFGYSQGYGEADHSMACEILKKNYPDYSSIEWSNDGQPKQKVENPFQEKRINPFYVFRTVFNFLTEKD